MTTPSDLCNQIDRELLVNYSRPIYDSVALNYNSSITTVQLTSLSNLAAGAILDVNFELMYVLSWNSGTKTATVIRGFLGSTAAAGVVGNTVRVNPRYSTVAMFDGIVDELRSWDERVFTTAAEALSYGESATTVLASPARTPYRLLSARARPISSYDLYKWVPAELRIGEATAQFATGFSVSIAQPFGVATTVDVLYALPIDISAVATSTNLEGLGIGTGMLEIIKWGALARLTAGKEAQRLDPAAFARPDVEQAVPATAHLQAAAQYQRLRDLAYDREYRRLLALYPVRANK